jgi:hypothetical protein
MPPRTGLLPSRAAFSLSHMFSVLPPLLFQLVTVAPYSSTSTLSPDGSVATTLELEPEPTMSTWASGAAAEGALSADGLFARSTMVAMLRGVMEELRTDKSSSCYRRTVAWW